MWEVRGWFTLAYLFRDRFLGEFSFVGDFDVLAFGCRISVVGRTVLKIGILTFILIVAALVIVARSAGCFFFVACLILR